MDIVCSVVMIVIHQIASRVLRIPYSRIHISSTSTETVPNSSPTGASITADVNGMAVKVRDLKLSHFYLITNFLLVSFNWAKRL